MNKFVKVKSLLAKLWKILKLPTNLQLKIMRIVQDQFLVGVTGIIVNENNEILLFKHTYRQTTWSLPGGYLKKGEHPYDTLEREVNEESGLVIESDQNLQTQADRENARLDICIRGSHVGGTFRPSTEVSDYGFFSLNSLPKIPKDQLKLIKQTLSLQKNLNATVPLIPQRAFI